MLWCQSIRDVVARYEVDIVTCWKCTMKIVHIFKNPQLCDWLKSNWGTCKLSCLFDLERADTWIISNINLIYLCKFAYQGTQFEAFSAISSPHSNLQLVCEYLAQEVPLYHLSLGGNGLSKLQQSFSVPHRCVWIVCTKLEASLLVSWCSNWCLLWQKHSNPRSSVPLNMFL